MSDLSRRRFVQQLSILGALGAGTTLVGCGGGGSSDSGDMPAEEAPMAEEPASFSCMDTTGMEEADITMRNTLLYTDMSETEGQNCANCQLYVLPTEGANCGTCTTVKGPIHPEGWCSIWAAQTA